MAAAHIATITEEGNETVVRISGKINLPKGPVLVRENEATGEFILSSQAAPATQESWAAFFALIDSREPDPDFMRERPMNQLPVEKNLFPDD